MEFEEIDKKVKSLLGLDNLGFHEHTRFDGHYAMIRRDGEAIHRISYEFYPPNGMERKQFNWMQYNIIFPKVNSILKEAWGGAVYTDSINQPLLSDSYETTVIDAQENRMAIREFLKDDLLFFVEGGVFYEDRLIEACKYQRESIDRFMLPFFERLSTLQVINDQVVNAIPWEDLSSRISGQTPLKRMIIMKLCGNPAYEEFADMFEGRVKTAVEGGMKEYESFYAALKALRTYLDTDRYKTLAGA
ncbi:hypothetical protein [Chryseolinea soli]|uniref:DUF4304 domain-containing protein n=1 Tax=Chryseolinea soli TaxID=2321403 RepID=A0A385T1A9_9BACT|nr:hypothetical protein [Chryseolinea soli]AYB34888.1 hypothetical protein D4L85_31815 [Chryseolinea soli]